MSAGNNLPTDTEVLFFALQIVQRAETAAEAKVWAQEVLRFSGGSTEADVWPPPGAAEWQGKGSKPAPLYARMEKAYKSVWGFWELESICLAIRAWRGADWFQSARASGTTRGHTRSVEHSRGARPQSAPFALNRTREQNPRPTSRRDKVASATKIHHVYTSNPSKYIEPLAELETSRSFANFKKDRDSTEASPSPAASRGTGVV